ncbi:MAG: PKD repeat protein, partial [Halioglobus sp.]
PEDYLWDFGDGNTSDELEPNHTYAEKGVYEVCLTVSNIYDTSTSCKTIMLGTTSTIDKELEVDVSIYPNPTSDYLTINFHNYIALDGMVRFYDVSGREVKSVVLERASTILDLQNLPSGAYLYKVYDGARQVYDGKVVVVRRM